MAFAATSSTFPIFTTRCISCRKLVPWSQSPHVVYLCLCTSISFAPLGHGSCNILCAMVPCPPHFSVIVTTSQISTCNDTCRILVQDTNVSLYMWLVTMDIVVFYLYISLQRCCSFPLSSVLVPTYRVPVTPQCLPLGLALTHYLHKIWQVHPTHIGTWVK
jgi:hypothetical protein